MELREALSQLEGWSQSVVNKISTADENQAMQSLITNLKKLNPSRKLCKAPAQIA
jgi:hypothetical protein